MRLINELGIWPEFLIMKLALTSQISSLRSEICLGQRSRVASGPSGAVWAPSGPLK